MRLTLERNLLVRALAHSSRVVEKRNTIPILSNVCLKAEGGRLLLRATDLDLEIDEAIAAEISSEGSTTVAAHLLNDIVRKLPDGASVTLTLAADGSNITIQSGRSRFVLQTLDAGDFPTLSQGEFSHNFTIKASDLNRLINKTEFAISTEETRYYLNGIYLHNFLPETGAPVLRAVATDGHRLAKADMPAPEGTDGMPGVIIPRKTVSELNKLLGETDGEIAIALSTNKIRFTFAEVVLTSKLIDGTFPDYVRVIPANNNRVMDVDCDLFKKAVDRVATLSSERGRAIKFNVTPERLMLTCINPDTGTATEEVESNFEGDELEIGFNSKYLLDVANKVEGESIHFRLNDASSPALIEDTKDKQCLYVLMPMRV